MKQHWSTLGPMLIQKAYICHFLDELKEQQSKSNRLRKPQEKQHALHMAPALKVSNTIRGMHAICSVDYRQEVPITMNFDMSSAAWSECK